MSVKRGKDKKLEADANAWLAAAAGDNKRSNRRSVARDVEKMKFEHGLISAAELQHYDPDNDWTTTDSAFQILTGADGLDYTDADVRDIENIRARSRENPGLPDGVWGRAGEEERRGLSRRVDDDARPVFAKGKEKNAVLRDYAIGERKICKGPCGRSKGLDCFSPKADAKDGRHPVCKACRKEIVSQKRHNSSSG